MGLGAAVPLSTMRVDPVIAKIFAENVRAAVIERPAPSRLDPALIAKIGQRVAVFRGMSADCLGQTLALGEHYPVKQGDAVFSEHDIGESFFVVITGEVVVEKSSKSGPVALARLGSGECFGEMALADRKIRSASVRALRDTVTMRFYQQHIDANPAVAHIIYRNIARVLATRLDESSVMLANLVPPKVA